MQYRQTSVDFTTDASGDATVYSSSICGPIVAVRYVYGDADTGADLTLTTNSTGQTVLVKANLGTANVNFYPKAQNNLNTDGTAITGVYDYVVAAGELLKFVIAQGGASKTGTFIIVWMEADQVN